MAKCSFCGVGIDQGIGRMFVKVDGTILYFCSSKCRKNMLNLGRKPIHTRWSKLFKK